MLGKRSLRATSPRRRSTSRANSSDAILSPCSRSSTAPPRAPTNCRSWQRIVFSRSPRATSRRCRVRRSSPTKPAPGSFTLRSCTRSASSLAPRCSEKDFRRIVVMGFGQDRCVGRRGRSGAGGSRRPPDQKARSSFLPSDSKSRRRRADADHLPPRAGDHPSSPTTDRVGTSDVRPPGPESSCHHF
jgi:hypothetical protein